MKPHVCAIVLAVFACTGNVFAWTDDTYESFVLDVLELCPTELKDLLNENIFEAKKGALLPRTQFGDYENQVFIVSSGSGNAPRKIEQEYDRLVSLLKNPEVPSTKVARSFGILSTYTANMAEFPAVVEMPRQFKTLFERSILAPIKPPVLYDGADPIEDVRQFAVDTAKKAGKQSTPGACYDLAVNAVADIWIDAWQQAEKPMSSPAPPGKMLRAVDMVIEPDQTVIDLITKASSDASVWADEANRSIIKTFFASMIGRWNLIYDQAAAAGQVEAP